MAEGATAATDVQSTPRPETRQSASAVAVSPDEKEVETTGSLKEGQDSTSSSEDNETNVIVKEDDEENRSQSGNALLLNVTDDLTPLTDREPQLTTTAKPRSTSPFRCTCGRRLKRYILTVFLTILVSLYIVGGGFLFSHLESNRDEIFNDRTEKYKNDTAILLATELRQVSPYEDVWARTVHHYLDVFERDVLRASYLGYRRRDDPARDQIWTFRSAVFFSISLVTATGYGLSVPHSEWSRTIVLGYTAVGIPLTYAWLIVTGSTLAIFWSWLFDRLFCHICHKNHVRISPHEADSPETMSVISVHQVPEASNQLSLGPGRKNNVRCDSSGQTARAMMNNVAKPRVLYFKRKSLSSADHIVAILFSGVLFLAYFVFGSTAVAVTEGWSIADSVYFNFVMFATIGPGCQELEGGLSTRRWQAFRIRQNIGYSVFILVGFCLLSMFCNLVYNFYYYRKMRRATKRKKWLRINLNNSLGSLAADIDCNISKPSCS